MNYQDKTKKELVIELQELQQKYDSLKSVCNKELLGNEEKKYDLERKQAEKEIMMLADALKSINDGVSITDLEENIIFVNDSFLRIYGYSREELIGRSIDIVRSPFNPSEIVNRIKSSTFNGQWEGVLLNTRKDGCEFPISLTKSVIDDEKGIPVALRS
jgi:PAS domain S-box-containing protein